MDLIFVLVLSFVFLLISALNGIFVGYPLLATLLILFPVYLRRGFSRQFLIEMAVLGSRKSFSVLIILLLIGALTAVWMAAGTVPALVYYGVKLINPQYFVLCAFLLTSAVSVLIGTSFGTVSTIGIALMAIARGSEIDLHLVAGAIIAGAYVGDRCSPLSSSAHLVASLTRTDIHINLKNMARTALVPLLISALVYLILSWFNPAEIVNSPLTLEINHAFTINLIVLLPAFTVLMLSLFRVDVRLTILASIIIAGAITIGIQGTSLTQLCQYALLGYSQEETFLADIFKGGGIVSMAKVSVIVVISTALAGVLAGTKTLSAVTVLLKKARSRSALFGGTTLIAIAAAAFGCTQTIAILLTQQLVEEHYEQKLNRYQLAVDLENTAVVLSPLIPWNIAGLVPATLLDTDFRYIPYAFYLYFLPLFILTPAAIHYLRRLFQAH